MKLSATTHLKVQLLYIRPKCPVAIRIMSNEGNRIIAVKWAIHKLVSFLARISMTGIDRIGLRK